MTEEASRLRAAFSYQRQFNVGFKLVSSFYLFNSVTKIKSPQNGTPLVVQNALILEYGLYDAIKTDAQLEWVLLDSNT